MGRNLVARCAKFHRFIDVLRDPEDDDVIMKILREVHQFHKNFGYLRDAVHLRTKGTSVKNIRLRMMLKY